MDERADLASGVGIGIYTLLMDFDVQGQDGVSIQVVNNAPTS